MTDKNGTNGEGNIKIYYIYFKFFLIVSILMKIKQLTYSGVAYVIPWPLFVNHDCYIPKCLS